MEKTTKKTAAQIEVENKLAACGIETMAIPSNFEEAQAMLAGLEAEKAAPAAVPPCFGKMFDLAANECVKCDVAGKCRAINGDSGTEEAIAAEALGNEDPEAKEAELEAKEALVTEIAEKETAILETVSPPAPAPEAKKRGRKKKEASTGSAPASDPAPASTDPAARKKSKASVYEEALFVKQPDGKFQFFAPGTLPEGTVPDLIIKAGQKVKITSARSKYNGQELVVLHYSDKYNCIRCKVEGSAFTADFGPDRVEMVG